MLREVTVSNQVVASSSNAADPRPRARLALFAAIAALCAFGATGCVAEVQATPVVATYEAPVVYEEPVVYYAAAPVNVELYPRVYYRGAYVYYVDGRWYSPSPRGWVVYHSEPRELVRYRVGFERTVAHGHVRTHYRTTVPVSRPAAHPATHPSAPAHRTYRPSHASSTQRHHQ